MQYYTLFDAETHPVGHDKFCTAKCLCTCIMNIVYNFIYFKASFVSGQNEPNPAIVIGYLNRQDGSISPSLDYPRCPRRKISPKVT